MIESLCPPAIIFLVLTLIQIFIDIFKAYYKEAFFKFIGMVLITMLLNLLCNKGLGIIAWFLVFIPFILMTIISVILLIVFGINPAEGDYTVDIEDLNRKISKEIKAIVAIDLFGHVCNYDKILKIASSFNIPVIQDAAQSFGSKFNNKITGSYSDITCFSFRPAKNLYCMGDGGGVVSKNETFINQIKMSCDHGRTDKYVHEFICSNNLKQPHAKILCQENSGLM